MLQSDIIKVIESIAPLEFMESWDRSGVQVLGLQNNVTNLAICLDPIPQQIKKAADIGAEMVLTHHPLALSEHKLDVLDFYTDVVRTLYKHDMTLYSCHTSLDANTDGPASWLPKELNLQNTSFLEHSGHYEKEGQIVYGGIGCVGDLPESLTFTELWNKIYNSVSDKSVWKNSRFIGDASGKISRVAICTGSGASLMKATLEAHADLFITGDYKYHDALSVSSWYSRKDCIAYPMSILDVGHFSLEEEMMRRLAKILQERLYGVKVTFLPGNDPYNPVTALFEK